MFHLIPLAIAAFVLSACSQSLQARHELAAKLAAPSLPHYRLMHSGGFDIVSYTRIQNENLPARVYIEGDGLAFFGKRGPSPNPTPTNPIALRLAAHDNGPNVIWLARPCQYGGFNNHCRYPYWTSKRFAPEIISTYQHMLESLKQQYRFSSFELIGFSGGGAIAALLAENRNDVQSLRTIAGNLDHDTVNRLHHVPLMPESLNPRDHADRIAQLPQRHFIGGKDTIITPAVFDSFQQAMGPSPCIRSTLVETADHENGWEALWPQLLAEDVSCQGWN